MKPKEVKDWEKEFDDTFRNKYGKNSPYYLFDATPNEINNIKAFIQTLLEKQEKEIKEKIRGMIMKNMSKALTKVARKIGIDCLTRCEDQVLFYNQAIDDILSALKGKE